MSKLPLVLVLAAACQSSSSSKSPPTPQTKWDLKVDGEGFHPDDVAVPAGQPVSLVFTRTTDQTCATQVVIHTDDTNTVTKDLPLNQPVEVPVTFGKAGKLAFACGMDMFHGTILVQ